MVEVLFFLSAFVAIAGAIGVIALKNPFNSVLALVVHLIALAMLFLLLHGEFVAAAQVVVYAGAVMVLYVFVAAYVGEEGETWTSGSRLQRARACSSPARWPSCCSSRCSARACAASPMPTSCRRSRPASAAPPPSACCCSQRYLLAFEAASIMLLAAAVGAVLLARRRTGGVPEGPRVLSVTDLGPSPVPAR